MKHAVILYLMKNKIKVWTDVTYLGQLIVFNSTLYSFVFPCTWEVFAGSYYSQVVDTLGWIEKSYTFKRGPREDEKNPRDKSLFIG